MTRKMIVTVVDDLDGVSAADETVEFSIDRVVDLSAKNAERLRSSLTAWVAAGRRVGGRRRERPVHYRRVGVGVPPVSSPH